MKTQISELLKHILEQLGIAGIEPEVEIPDDPRHGEYTTNVAMRLAKILKKPPMELALEAAGKVKSLKLKVKSGEHDQKLPQKYQIKSIKLDPLDTLQAIERVEVAPPGFINFWLTEAKLSNQLAEVIKEKEGYGKAKKRLDLKEDQGLTPVKKRIMVEFAHPNTHKAFHIGHLRNISTGESIVRLLESQRIEVIRANYQGDVGMHIAKCLYALTRMSNIKDQISDIKTKTVEEKVDFLGKAYAAGNKAFEENKEAQKEIGEINNKIYAKDPSVFPLYQETRKWSLDYFESIYKRVSSHFDRYYFESEVYETGKQYVLEGLKKGIFAESEGAIIFPGEKYGLHNRVFITKEGNATYEGKDVGLVRLQLDEYHPGLIIHVVGPEQAGYFEVLFKALEQLFPETKGKEFHLIYGWVRLKKGKMSSRTGQVVTGEWLLDEAKQSIYKIIETSASPLKDSPLKVGEKKEIAEKAAVAAVKYAFLRVSTKQEIAFDLKESVSFEGDSGPYIQYTYARCRSVLRKFQLQKVKPFSLAKKGLTFFGTLNPEERAVARLILYFPEVIAQAAQKYAPNLLCIYLYQLAQAFNLFYQKHTILGGAGKSTDNLQPTTYNNQVALRLTLTAATAQVLHNGLYLLGIATLERM